MLEVERQERSATEHKTLQVLADVSGQSAVWGRFKKLKYIANINVRLHILFRVKKLSTNYIRFYFKGHACVRNLTYFKGSQKVGQVRGGEAGQTGNRVER